MTHSDNDLSLELERRPAGEPVEIDGEKVYLKIGSQGAELGVYLFNSYKPYQLNEALRFGFPSAMSYDAGLAQAPNGSGLALTQWLPNVSRWGQAIDALENLMNQVADWRMKLEPEAVVVPRMKAGEDRNERLLRSLLMGARK